VSLHPTQDSVVIEDTTQEGFTWAGHPHPSPVDLHIPFRHHATPIIAMYSEQFWDHYKNTENGVCQMACLCVEFLG